MLDAPSASFPTTCCRKTLRWLVDAGPAHHRPLVSLTYWYPQALANSAVENTTPFLTSTTHILNIRQRHYCTNKIGPTTNKDSCVLTKRLMGKSFTSEYVKFIVLFGKDKPTHNCMQFIPASKEGSEDDTDGEPEKKAMPRTSVSKFKAWSCA